MITPPGSPSHSRAPSPIPSTSDVSASKRARLSEPLTFKQKLDKWVTSRSVISGEQRDRAVIEIEEVHKRRAETLNLGNLRLASLPSDALQAMPYVKELHLQNNRFTAVPLDAIAKLPNLKTLVLSNNQLTTLPQFDGLENLEVLHLANTQLTTLSEDTFIELKSLRMLYLDSNQLTTLPRFDRLEKLDTLHLGRNQFTTLSKDTFIKLESLRVLSLDGNQLAALVNDTFTKLKKLKHLNLKNNPFIFKPTLKSSEVKIMGEFSNLRTIEEEFVYGNTHLLDFNLNAVPPIPGTITAQGKIKLRLMLEHANETITTSDKTYKNSSVINQLLYQLSVLPDDDTENQAIKLQGAILLAEYLDRAHIKQFAEQAEEIGVDPFEYEGFTFVTNDGTKGLTITKSCYEASILEAPFADKNHANAKIVNGILVHDINLKEALTLQSINYLKEFRLLRKSYMQGLNKTGIDTLFNSMNMGDDYKARFMEALTVSSVNILVGNRGRTPEERNEILASYKMLDATSTMRLFNIFSQFVNDSGNSAMERLANRDAIITDEHFTHICQAFPDVLEQDYAALMFILAMVFIYYASRDGFGNVTNSATPLRYYASALLNKLKALNSDLFNQSNCECVQDLLFKDCCSYEMVLEMRSIVKKNPVLQQIYEEVMPLMWQ